MMLNIDRNFIAPGLLLTALIFIAHYFLPHKRFVLHPHDTNISQIYSYADANTGQTAAWKDEQNNAWHCNFEPHHESGCGWEIYRDQTFTKGFDFSAFTAIEVTIAYHGPATRIRFYLRNFNEAYSTPGDSHSTKYLSMTIPVAELDSPVLVNFTEFSVASWWLQKQNVRRQWALPEFDSITNVGVDFIEHGVHETRVDKIVLVGPWIKTETLLFIILGVWMTIFILQAVFRYFLLFKKSQHERHLIQSLEEKHRELEKDKKSLRELADTDPLTGVLNRSGIEHYLEKVLPDVEIGVILMDLDHFRQINDTYGHDMGDKVLKAFAAAMVANLRSEDMFARWGGEEFIVICQNKSLNTLYNVADKLRKIVAQYTFGVDFELRISVSIGIALSKKGESFEEILKRADNALYKAKHHGRDRVEYQ